MAHGQIYPKPGKQLRLFEDSGIYQIYRYSCFVTKLSLSAKMVYDLYRNRADAENRIKEIKYDFAFDSVNSKTSGQLRPHSTSC